MSTFHDPMNVHWPEMIDDQEQNTVFLKPLVASPKKEVAVAASSTVTCRNRNSYYPFP
jgi:hypothetical protein